MINMKYYINREIAKIIPNYSSSNKIYRLLILMVVLIQLLTSCVGTSPLFKAIRHDDIDEVNRLVNEGANVNEITKMSNCTPLWSAIVYKHPTEIIEALLKNGADVNAGCAGWTPLQGAAGIGRTDVVKLLLERKPNIDAINPHRNQTALDIAIQKNQTEIVQLIRNARKEQLGDLPESAHHTFTTLDLIGTFTKSLNENLKKNSTKPTSNISSPVNQNSSSDYLKNAANKAEERNEKNNRYYYELYTNEAEREWAEAKYHLEEAKHLEQLAGIGARQGKDESLNLEYAKKHRDEYKRHKAYAQKAEENAKIYK